MVVQRGKEGRRFVGMELIGFQCPVHGLPIINALYATIWAMVQLVSIPLLIVIEFAIDN